ncbi:hypothetical protein [Pseudomonas sp. B14(2017)]|uniref:hypothetical protein n=1 Tax=Pseudomonas sp. B14(2017) TaxID=1981745 RepID=UPI00117A6A2B|nr:hypothetical protein [Pseudomonas sp. B14(2017)]
MSERQKFTTRDWWFVIALLVLVQFIIHWLSLQYSGSQSALGYVSFAGTLVSIMLGLIAIIYSFVQSISQNNSVVEIRDQVERLMAAGQDIADSGKAIHAASQGINHLVEDLVTKVVENTSAAKEILGGVTTLTSSLDMYSASNSRVEVKGGNDSVGSGRQEETSESSETSTLVNPHRIVMAISVLSLYEIAKRGYTFREGEDKFVSKLAKHTGLNKDFLAGSMSAVLMALETQGYIELPETDVYLAKLKFSDDFTSAMKVLIPETMAGDHEQFNAFWLAVNEKDVPANEGQ